MGKRYLTPKEICEQAKKIRTEREAAFKSPFSIYSTYICWVMLEDYKWSMKKIKNHMAAFTDFFTKFPDENLEKELTEEIRKKELPISVSLWENLEKENILNKAIKENENLIAQQEYWLLLSHFHVLINKKWNKKDLYENLICLKRHLCSDQNMDFYEIHKELANRGIIIELPTKTI